MAIVKVTKAMAERSVAQIDWAAQDALTDDDIARQVAENPDAAPILTAGETVSTMALAVRGVMEPAPEDAAVG